jgi:hypothetical protein
MPTSKPASFQQRVNYAAQSIRNQDTKNREFDSCFEMHDGDLVAAALVRRARQDAELYAAMLLWQTKGRSAELPAEWLEAERKYKSEPSLARKARTVRRIREKESAKILNDIRRKQGPNEDELVRGLRAFAAKINSARFYVDLQSDDSSSGFYAKAQTRRAAQAEARNHLRQYPVWQTATVRRAHQ